MIASGLQTSAARRFGELVLWSSAAVVILSVHVAIAAYLMREEPVQPAENAPPAAIMIELAPEPVAANTQEEQISPDMQDSEQVESDTVEPIEEPLPEPVPEPVPQPVEPPPPEILEPVEPPPPEPAPPEEVAELPPEPTPQPPPEIVEPPPEPVEEIDPLEQQMTAALENVEVPLPTMRPPPPPEKPPEPKKVEVKRPPVKKVEPPKPRQQPPAQREMAEAKLQTKEADRTAAQQTTSGSLFSSNSPAKWKSRVQARLARRAGRCPGSALGTAAVRFSFDGSGNITNVSLSRSSGNPEIDSHVVAVVKKASPIPTPPPGVPNYLDQALTCVK